MEALYVVRTHRPPQSGWVSEQVEVVQTLSSLCKILILILSWWMQTGTNVVHPQQSRELFCTASTKFYVLVFLAFLAFAFWFVY